MQTPRHTAPIRGVIFDVDGTLVDSNDLHIEAWRVAFERYGKKVSYDEVHAQIGKGGDQLMPVFLSPDELERFGEELEAFRVELFVSEYLPRAQPFPKVRELVETLRRDGRRIVLATSAKKKELTQHLEKLGIESLLDGYTTADDAEHSKPCPDIFEAGLAKLDGVRPEQALVVGDSPYDVRAAKRAGIATIGLLSGGFSADSLRSEGAIAVYRDVADLLERYEGSPFSPGAAAA